MSLVYSDFSLGSHVMEPLLRVDSRSKRSRPRSSVHCRSSLFRVIDILPVYQEGDGVFSLWVASHRCGDTGRSRGSDFGRDISTFDHPAVDLKSVRPLNTRQPEIDVKGAYMRWAGTTHIDVVRVEVIGDIGIDTGPRLESLKLEFRLRHVRAVKVEVAKFLSSSSSIIVSRIESLVAEESALPAFLYKEL